MKGWDVRENSSFATFVCKEYDAGVTTIQNSPYSTACMRGGFNTVSTTGEKLNLILNYDEHEPESLAYGIDWLDEGYLGCCSFYDHKLTVCESFVE